MILFEMPEGQGPAQRLGGKGANLSRLSKEGVCVPPWLILTTEFFETLLGPRFAEIDQLAAKEAPAQASRQISQIFSQLTLPPDLQSTLLTKAAALGESLAVRSSAVDEDSATHSFAGQLDTFLFQEPNESLIAAVLKCAASAWSERALVYRQTHQLSRERIRCAVVLQKMIQAQASGVAFTANPVNGNPSQVMVNAVYGVGEGLVSGELDCDSWVLDAQGDVVTQDLRAERLLPNVGPSLGPELLRQLHQTCLHIEQQLYAGQPQDIEWCTQEGQLYVLQARPIAAFAKLRKAGEFQVFDNSNVVESYSGVPSKLTYTFARASFRETFRGVHQRVGLSRKRLEELKPVYETMLVHVHGHMYYQLLHWYRFFQEVPMGGDNLREFDQLIGIAPENAVDAPFDSASPWLKLQRFYWGRRLKYRTRIIHRVAHEFTTHFDSLMNQYVNEPFAKQDNGELLRIYRQVFAHCSPNWDGEIVNFIGGQHCYTALEKRLQALGFTDVPALQNDLIGGDGGIASMRPTRQMIEIADLIRAQPAWREAFLNEAVESLPELVAQDPTFRDLRPRLQKFIEDYGCRVMNELKLEEPTFWEDPTFLYSTLINYVKKRPDTLDAQLAHQIAAKRKAEALVYSRGSPWQKWRLRRLIERVRKHVYFREELRLYRGKYWGVVRRIFRAVGRNLQAHGQLKNWDDIFHLEVEEVAGLIQAPPAKEHTHRLIEQRRAEHAANLLKPMPSRIYAYGDRAQENFAVSLWTAQSGPASQDPQCLRGIACGPGRIRAKARVVLPGMSVQNLEGQILVTDRTDPGWIPLYPSIAGLVIERGSVLSHSAVVAREMGIPTVVGVSQATQRIRTGDEIDVDGSQGTVRLLN